MNKIHLPPWYKVRDWVAIHILGVPVKPDLNDRLNHKVEWDGWKWFHNEPLRSHIFNEAYRIFWANKTKPIKKVRNVIWHWLMKRRLSKARKLTYGSYCYEVPGTPQIDGYIEFEYGKGKKGRLGLDITSLGDAKHWTEEAWARGEVQVGGFYNYFGEYVAIVPFEGITPETAREAIIRWYMVRYEWERGHWCFKEKRLPEFTFDIGWLNDNSAEVATWKASENGQEYLQRLREFNNRDETEFNAHYGRTIKALTHQINGQFETEPDVRPMR